MNIFNCKVHLVEIEKEREAASSDLEQLSVYCEDDIGSTWVNTTKR